MVQKVSTGPPHPPSRSHCQHRPTAAATGEPSIEGTPELRSVLTAGAGTIADANGLNDAVYTYQWIRVDGLSETDIAGAVDMTYTTTTDDIDKSIKVAASFTDDDGYSEARTSNPVGPVTAVTCAAPDLGGRVEVWRAVVTVKPIFAGVLFTGYGYGRWLGWRIVRYVFRV